MSNTLTALQKKQYSREVQKELYFKVLALSMANMVDMPHGTTYDKPSIDFNDVDQYVKNTDITVQDTTSETETLTINKTPIVPTGIDEVELLEISYDLLMTVARNAAQVIREDLDGNFFYEGMNAEHGNSTPVALVATGASANVVSTYSTAVASLVNEGVDEQAIDMVIDPHSKALIGEAALGNTYQTSDVAYRRGFRGEFVGANTAMSALLTMTTSLNMATNPTASDTVTFNGIVFTFVSSIGSTAGNVLIGASAAATRANLIAALTGGSGAGTTYIALTNRQRRKLPKTAVIATENGTAIDLVIKRGYRQVSSNLTAAADKFAAVVINNIIMQRKSISLAVQKGINVVTRDKPLQIGTNFFTWMRYGLKTFREGRERMYRLQIIVQAAE